MKNQIDKVSYKNAEILWNSTLTAIKRVAEKGGIGIGYDVPLIPKEPDAEFSEVGTKFITTFKRRSYFEGKKGFEKLGEKVVEKLTATRQKIINHMQQNKTISAKELSGIVGISQRKIQENISWLKEKGLIKRIGPDKGGYWEVVKK